MGFIIFFSGALVRTIIHYIKAILHLVASVDKMSYKKINI